MAATPQRKRFIHATELTIAKGELLDVREEAGGWLRCRTSSGHEGWVPGDNVEPV